MNKKLEKDIMEEEDLDYILDLNKTKDLKEKSWRYDRVPQIVDGWNIADFIDPDIAKV